MGQEIKSNDPDGRIYPLRTLRDIFELPSYEHIERCIDELKIVILQARATNDFLAAISEHKGNPLPNGKCFMWPEVLEWNDDGKSELGSDYVDQDGKSIMSMRIVKSDNKDNQ